MIEKQTEYYICPGCGNFKINANHFNPEYCDVCGEQMISKCVNCSEPIVIPFAKYCTKCGTLLKQVDIKKSHQ